MVWDITILVRRQKDKAKDLQVIFEELMSDMHSSSTVAS